MKIFLIASLLSLAGCSDLSENEEGLVGSWEWNYKSGKFSEVGYVVLNSDRTHTYKFSSTNLTERIVGVQDEVSGHWRVNNGWLCLASEWRGGNLFNKVIVDKEVCHWEVTLNDNGQVVLSFKSGFTTDGVIAYPKKA